MTYNEMKQRVSEIKNVIYPEIQSRKLKYAEYWEVWGPYYNEMTALEKAIKNAPETKAAQEKRIKIMVDVLTEAERLEKICNDDGNSPYSG